MPQGPAVMPVTAYRPGPISPLIHIYREQHTRRGADKGKGRQSNVYGAPNSPTGTGTGASGAMPARGIGSGKAGGAAAMGAGGACGYTAARRQSRPTACARPRRTAKTIAMRAKGAMRGAAQVTSGYRRDGTCWLERRPSSRRKARPGLPMAPEVLKRHAYDY